MPSRTTQQRARQLAEALGISYVAALNRIRSGAATLDAPTPGAAPAVPPPKIHARVVVKDGMVTYTRTPYAADLENPQPSIEPRIIVTGRDYSPPLMSTADGNPIRITIGQAHDDGHDDAPLTPIIWEPHRDGDQAQILNVIGAAGSGRTTWLAGVLAQDLPGHRTLLITDSPASYPADQDGLFIAHPSLVADVTSGGPASGWDTLLEACADHDVVILDVAADGADMFRSKLVRLARSLDIVLLVAEHPHTVDAQGPSIYTTVQVHLPGDDQTPSPHLTIKPVFHDPANARLAQAPRDMVVGAPGRGSRARGSGAVSVPSQDLVARFVFRPRF